jgi:hypothetical protein
MKKYADLISEGWNHVGFADAMMPWYAVCNLAGECGIRPKDAGGLIVGWPPGQMVFRIVPGQAVEDPALKRDVTSPPL